MMTELLKDVIYVIFVVVLSITAHYLIPYLKKLSDNAATKEIFEVVERAVRYAEQTITGDKKGKEKLNTVQMYVSDWLNKRGISVSPKDLNVLIESAVYIMNHEMSGE